MEKSKQENQKQDPGPEVVDRLESDILDICNVYINNLDNPNEIYENNGLFVDMLKYIYKHYIGDILHNKTYDTSIRYDYSLLDRIFNIYTSLVYKYKANKRPSILEYALFVNIDRHVLYNIANGMTKKATPDDIHNVKSWFLECENQLTNGGSVFEIFLLKSQYRYNDSLAPVPYENQLGALTAEQLPDFNACHNATLTDKSTEKRTGKSP